MSNRGRGRGGRGSAPSLAQRGRGLSLAEAHTLIAIVNGNFSSLIFPHQHAALGRGPVPALPFQLQQSVVIAHHPVFTHDAFLLQPEDLVQLSCRWTAAMIIGFGRRRVRVTVIVFSEIALLQKGVGLVVVPDPGQAQFLRPADPDACRAPVPRALWLAANWRR